MDGISHHSGTVSEDTSYELEKQQHDIHCTAYQRHLIDLPLSQAVVHFLFSLHHDTFWLQKYNISSTIGKIIQEFIDCF